MAVCLNDLGDGFITFPDFQRQLRALEATMFAPVKALIAKTQPPPIRPVGRAPESNKIRVINGHLVPDGMTMEEGQRIWGHR